MAEMEAAKKATNGNESLGVASKGKRHIPGKSLMIPVRGD
jgi:hypothetical protein